MGVEEDISHNAPGADCKTTKTVSHIHQLHPKRHSLLTMEHYTIIKVVLGQIYSWSNFLRRKRDRTTSMAQSLTLYNQVK